MQEVGGSIPPGSTSLRLLRKLRLGKPSRSEGCRVVARRAKTGLGKPVFPSLRASGSRECAPDDRLREAIHAHAGEGMDCFVAEFIIGPAEGGTRWLLAMTGSGRAFAKKRP